MLTFNTTERRFLFKCSYDERHLPKEAGFRWDAHSRQWYTHKPEIATKLKTFADDKALEQIQSTLITLTEHLGKISFPKRLTPYPFQFQAVTFALERNRCYLALDPGLGKTIISALVCNTIVLPTVYVAPPFLLQTIYEEFQKWSTLENWEDHLLLVPDSKVSRPTVHEQIKEFIGDGSARLIADEAHRFKNAEAHRTRALFGNKEFQGIVPLFSHVIFLSGTPMPNRPMELFPVLSKCAPETIGYRNHFEFGRHYCAGHKTEFGWDFTGSSNMSELAKRVKEKFMLRIRKKDVLKELPPKTEEMVFIGDRVPAKIAPLDKSLLKSFSPEDLMKYLAPNDHVSTYRKELGIHKVSDALPFIRFLLEDSEESILLFCIHKEVVKKLREELSEFNPFVVTGDTPMHERHEAVKEFQSNPARRLFVGNIQAAGVGFTLTKASRVVFLEFSWVPGDNDQASDRAHRIGQSENVFVQYLVYKNSLDKVVLESVLRKRKSIEHL